MGTIKRWTATGMVANRSRFGRPRVTSERKERKIVQFAQDERALTSQKFTKAVRNEYEFTVGHLTIRRRLFDANMTCRGARKKPPLTKTNVAKRLSQAKKHEPWASDDWAKILCSDESNFFYFWT